MKFIVAILACLAFAGCLDSDPEPATSFIIEIRNAGETAHYPTLKLTGPDGVMFNKKVMVPGSGSYERTWEMAEGAYRAEVKYDGPSNGGNTIVSDDNVAHTWVHNDCPMDAIRIVFSHVYTIKQGENRFSSGGSVGYCE